MRSFSLSLTLVGLALFSPAYSQLSLPNCIRDCINKSPDTTCSTSDIACLCRASNSNFLPNLVTCIHDDCVNIDPSILTGPLQFACNIAGAPIPDSIIDEVKSKASELATATTTVTQELTRVSSVLVTTTEQGSTLTLIYPITIEKTTTVSGEPSTVTKESTTTATQLVPVVVTTTDSAGSTYTTTTTVVSTASASTSRASGNGGSASTSRGSSTSRESTTTILTSTTIAGEAVTSTLSSATSTSTRTNGASNGQTDSAPFTGTNVATGLSVGVTGSWLGLVIAVVAGAIWF